MTLTDSGITPGSISTSQRDDAGQSVQDLIARLNPVWEGPGSSVGDGMPVGNGNLVCLAWVDERRDICLRVALNDSWDENARSIGLSYFRIRLSPNPLGGVVFRQTLDYGRGRILISAQHPDLGDTSIVIWSDANTSGIHVEVQSALPHSLEVSSERWRTSTTFPTVTAWQDYIHVANAPFDDRPGTPVILSADRVVAEDNAIVFYHRNDTSCWDDTVRNQSVAFADLVDPYTYRTTGAYVRGSGLVSAGPERIVSAVLARSTRIDIVGMTRMCPVEATWLVKARELSDRLWAKDLGELRTAHEVYWTDFWNHSYLFASGTAEAEQATRGWIAARYLMAVQGRSEGAIEFNGGAFTLEEDVKLWHDYTQYNQRFAYWSMLASGDFDLMQSYFDVAVNAMPVSRAKSQAMWGHGGVMLPEHMIFGGFQSGSHYGWDRTGRVPSDLFDPYTRYLYNATAEIAVMMLDRYRYAPEDDFAIATLIPFASEVAEWHDAHWPREAGKLVLHPVYSGEMDRNLRNPAVELAGLARLLDGLLALPERLTTPADRDRWTRLRTELPELRIVNGKLATSEDLERGQDTNNQQLYSIFPYGLFGAGQPDEAIAHDSFLDRRGKAPESGSEAWRYDAIVAAHLGLTDQARDQAVRALTRYKYRYEGFLDGDPDGDHSIEPLAIGKTALQAMLVRPVGSTVQVFPGWPSDWSVRFRLWAPQETSITGEYVAGESPVTSVVPAERSRDLVFVGPGPLLRDGAHIRLSLAGTELALGHDGGAVLRLKDREQSDPGQEWIMAEVEPGWCQLVNRATGAPLTSSAPGDPSSAGGDDAWRIERLSGAEVTLVDSTGVRCLEAQAMRAGSSLGSQPRTASARQRFIVELTHDR